MQETEFLALNNPSYLIRVIFHLTFLVITFFALEGIDWAKVMRKNYYQRGILIHTLVSIAISFLVTKFFLTILFKAYI